MGVGFSFGVTRMLLGLGSVTNLDNHNPWGIWISFDVACGVALAAGGFTTAPWSTSSAGRNTCPCSVPPSSRRFWATSGSSSR